MASLSTRKGRTLGSGKPANPVIPDRLRSPEVISPSQSSVSLSSQISTSKSSNDGTDISTAATLQAQSHAAAASASSRMVCPICNDEMVTLLQLNRHLDDVHKHLEVEEQDEVKTWFKTQMVKAKKFQPLAVLNQKLKGLDVFESNDERRPVSGHASSSGHASPEPSIARAVDREELITREHWQRYTRDNTCSDPMCDKQLRGLNGNINCRKCGKLFCEEHSMYQMKLSRSAQHDPVRGYWYRVCETCYKSRQGYNDHTSAERNHMDLFSAARRKAVDKSYLEVSRLEKRLTKLLQILSNPQLERDKGTVSYLWSFSGAKSQRRQAEETVVDWEDDAGVSNCPFCSQEFSGYTFRKHHCRLCGRVVCSDPATNCSSEVGLDITLPSKDPNIKPAPVSVDVRMCKDCKHVVFSKADFKQSLAVDRPDHRAFQNLKQFERGIRMMLPRFQKLLSALQDPDIPPTTAVLSDATRVRKRLTDSFTQFEVASRRIRDLPSRSVAQMKLQKAVYAQASSFLHLHMLPLKSLPKILKHASPHGRSISSSTIDGHLAPEANGHARGPMSTIQRSALQNIESSSQPSSASRLSSLETEEKTVREQLIVLEEQKFMVGEMLADSQRRRKFEEVESLSRNVEDLTKECDHLQGVLAGLRTQVEDVWTGTNS